MTDTLAIEATGLRKAFGATRAVDGVDLSVPRGAVYGVLGPNGAGKTTLMRMLATLLRPDAGSASVMGHDLVGAPHEIRGAIAMTGQFASLDDDRPRSQCAAGRLADDPRACRNRRDDPAHHPVPGGSGPAGLPHRGDRQGP